MNNSKLDANNNSSPNVDTKDNIFSNVFSFLFVGAGEEIRTLTVWFLKPVTLPSWPTPANY